MRYHFGRHTLDLDTHELLADGCPIHLEPQTFALLAHLICHRHRVVSKEELLDAVWGDHFVSESALTTRIKHLRRAVGDDGRAQHVVRTVHRVGYQFLPDVMEDDAAEPSPVAGSLARAGSRSSWTTGRTSPIFGRNSDLAALIGRVRDHRLVTVTGPAGVGKTALAAQLLECVPDLGQELAVDDGWLCELANTRGPGALTNVVLDAIGQGQHSDADPSESLLRVLERHRTLLVLDNCEHLVDAAAVLAGALLPRCPGVRIVTTSRVPLGIAGESVLALDPLELDDAVACFTALATGAGANLAPGDRAVRELCQRLDCLPLALELAAARARLLSPSEILELLTDRFRLLRDERNGDGRHQSLHRAIAWTWDVLTASDQQLLAAITVFAGSFSLEDVAGAVLDGGDKFDAVDALERLVASSLLSTRPGPWGKTRFRMLESVADFAADRLGGAAAPRQHARHFATLAEQLDALCQTEQLDEAMAAMAAAWDNLRAAVHHAAEARDTATVRRIIRAVGPYADVVQAYEVLDWCDHAALDRDADRTGDGADGALLAEVMAVQARMLAHRGEQDRARDLAAAAHARHESHATLLSVVWCAYYDGDLDRIVDAAPRLVELSRSARGLDRGFADGFAAIVVAVRQIPELEATTTSPGDADDGALGALDCLTAGLRLCTADPERATHLLEAVVAASLRNDYKVLLGAAASTLTQITLPALPTSEAMRTLRRTLGQYLDRGMWMLISADTVMAAKLLADAGDVETACRLIGARRASGYHVGLSEVLHTQLHDELGARLGDRFELLATQGEHWRPPDAANAALDALDRCLASW